MSDSQRPVGEMQRPLESSSTDDLVRLAAGAEPAPWETGRTNGAIANAMRAAGHGGHDDGEASSQAASESSSTTGWRWAAAACVLLAASGAAWALRSGSPGEVAEAPDPASDRSPTSGTLTMDTGDRVTASSDATWSRSTTQSVRNRQLVVERGVVLFDVEPLEEAERFEVIAHGTRVSVRGTVFSVEQSQDVTRVRVYEGRVEVAPRGGGAPVLLEEGAMWTNGVGRAALVDGQHASIAREAVQRRAAGGDEAGPVAALAEPRGAVDPSADGADGTDVATGAPGAAVDSTEPDALDVAATEPDAERAEPRMANGAPRPAAGSMRPRSTTTTAARGVSGPSLNDAQGALRTGDPARALALCEDPRRGRPGAARWSLLRADALRALGRHTQAADAYDLAARRGASRAESAYTAARLRFGRLGDPAGALRSLEAAGGSGALGERASALRVRALVRLGRAEEARTGAEHYLARFPNGGLRDWMRELIE